MKKSIISASVEDLARGYVLSNGCFKCLFCDFSSNSGEIYPVGNRFFDAESFMKQHVSDRHGSAFAALLALDKKITGLSEHQVQLLAAFHAGKSDIQIQNELEIGSSSTVRNHRFVFKEKELQAKVYLALVTQLHENKKSEAKSTAIAPHRNAKMVDDRYQLTLAEKKAIVAKYFPEGITGRIAQFPLKEKRKIVVLGELIKRFIPEKNYTEQEVNSILKCAYSDFATLRRYFIEYGFMARKEDGSSYWRISGSDDQFIGEGSAITGDLKADKEMKIKYQAEPGVYCIKNKITGHVLVSGTTDLKTINGKKFALAMGSSHNKKMQAEWNQYGAAAFEFEILQTFTEEQKTGLEDLLPAARRKALREYEKQWIEKMTAAGFAGF